LIALAVAAFLFLFVFPTRSYLAQRRQVSNAQHDVDVLRQQNQKLADEAQQLQSTAEVERRARQDYNMAYPGEQVYKVLPAATTTTTVP
jgi:cell division protein FtsB